MTRFGGGPNDLIVRRRSKSSLSCNIVSRDRANSSGSSSSSIVENFYLDKNFHRFRKFFFFFAPVRFHLFRKKGIGVRIGISGISFCGRTDTQTAARFPPVIMQIGYRLPVKTPDKNNANPQRAIGYLQIRIKKKKKKNR